MSQVSVLHYFISRAIKMLKSHILDLKKVLLDNKSKLWCISFFHLGSTGGSDGKESTCNAGDLGLIPGLGKFPGEGKGYPFQYSGLENSMDCVAHGATNSWTRWVTFTFQIYQENNILTHPVTFALDSVVSVFSRVECFSWMPVSLSHILLQFAGHTSPT